MTEPLEQLQSDVLSKLLSESLLTNINLQSLRKLQITSQLALEVIYLGGRNGKIGCGVEIAMPTFAVEHPNTPGPHGPMLLPIRIYEQPIINLEASQGTLQSAETVAMLILRLLHRYNLGYCSLYADQKAIQPIEGIPELVVYEITLRCVIPNDDLPRITTPLIGGTPDGVTLTAYEDGVAIYYTVDGSFPGPGNSAAMLYVQAFHVASGAIVRYAGYKNNWNGSDAGQAEITRGLLSTDPAPQIAIETPEGGGILID